VIDEAAFTKDGDNGSEDSMMGLREKGIKPTLARRWSARIRRAGTRTVSFTTFARTLSTGFMNFMRRLLINPLLPKRAGNEWALSCPCFFLVKRTQRPSAQMSRINNLRLM
jgi:hypothetical protein